MDPKFQTSFIPKKPVAGSQQGISAIRRPKSGGTNIFMSIAVFLFVISLVAVGGAYIWKQYLISTQVQYRQELTDRENKFDISQIETLKSATIQISTAKQLLRQHLALSRIFDIISKLTVESVRFLSLDLTAPESSADGLKITMSGYGVNLSTLAFQSSVFGSLEQYGLHDVVKNPILSNPALDQSGTVSFNFSATVDPSKLSYQKIVTATSTSF